MDSDVDIILRLLREAGLVLAAVALVLAVVIAMAWLWLKRALERHAESVIERSIEQHRQQLQLSADSVRLDFQRRLADFAIFNAHRHRSYRVIFRRALKAQGALAGFFGLTFASDYSDASKEEVAQVLTREEVPGKHRDQILESWEGNQKHAVQLLHTVLRQAREVRALQEFQQFKNAFLLGELYISQPVREALHTLNSVLASLSAQVTVPSEDGMKALSLKDESTAALMRVRDAMVDDLRRGDYGASIDAALPAVR
ncbi:MAG: hypothetical protein U0164_03740 [Gemmatimonadaceae bacterium]